MTNKEKDFISKIPENNTEWVAVQMITNFSQVEFKTLKKSFKKLNEALFKSWARQMTLEELLNAIEIVEDLK